MKLVRIVAFALATLVASPSFATDGPKWSEWSEDLFARAQAEQRFVILDLEAVWCHWCHVMEKTTYANPEVRELLAAKYLPVRVDQDANPDLSSRYGDWGWPATIVFGPDGTEIAKIRGYIEPERMQALLKAIIDDPSPGPSVGEAFEVKPSTSAFLDKEQRTALSKNVDESYEEKLGGWGENQKYIDADSMDLAITRAEAGDATAIKRARQTLDAAIALIDPVWGGVYQYSEGGSWTRAHFEKIMSFQAQYLRQYSQAYALWKDPKYLAAARNIERYLAEFLTSPTARSMSARMPISITTPMGTNTTRCRTASAANWACHASTRIYTRAKMAGRFRAFRVLQRHQRCQGAGDRRTRGEMGDRQPRAAGWRFPSWRKGSRRPVPRRYAGDGPGLPRSLCRHGKSRLAHLRPPRPAISSRASGMRPAAS